MATHINRHVATLHSDARRVAILAREQNRPSRSETPWHVRYPANSLADLKPANILYKLQGPSLDHTLFKITDLGNASRFDELIVRGCGTHFYMPPEITRYNVTNTGLNHLWAAPGAVPEPIRKPAHGSQDMWSLFCMIFYEFDHHADYVSYLKISTHCDYQCILE